MEEKILSVAEFSMEIEKEKREKNKKTSLLGVLFPLIVPAFIFIYLLSEEKKLSNLDPLFQVFFWVCIVFSCVLFLCHGEFKEIQDKTISNITEETQKQSLVISNLRIFGNCNGEFSFLHSEIERVYSTQVAGSQAELVLLPKQGEPLKFKCVKNRSTIISIVSQLGSKKEDNQEYTSTEKEETSRIEKVVSEKRDATACKEAPVQGEVETTEKTCDVKTELFDVVIVSATTSLQHIKVIRQITLMDLKEAKELLSALPYTLLKSVTLEEANDVIEKLQSNGIRANLRSNEE